ncbi:hypothetical protein [Metabacillus iocasae]|uniref:DNA-binding protein H-NS n=1 Tax=Priestia iocasae TaxID=2291674 RepID=A0ABS2QZH3_9BACI|nr:hypothetical protein [Metabacillus iocasae]MBM7704407.1 DNA-binding protein H-NS [Metabacillus iocasae]
MGLWSLLGIASKKEINELNETISRERAELEKTLIQQFQEQKEQNEQWIQAFEKSLHELKNEHREKLNVVEDHVQAVTERVHDYSNLVKSQGEDIAEKLRVISEIAKIQWASTLIDYVDELVQTAEIEKQREGNTKHPYHYQFGEVTDLFHAICNETQQAGMYIDWKNTKQTVQIFLHEDDARRNVNQIGAIQYEGSNDFGRKAPTTVSWRFNLAQLPSGLKRDLEAIGGQSSLASYLEITTNYVTFKFKEETLETHEAIKKIGRMLRKCVLVTK